jgi:CO/xanthine dehydrogenase FAD-binding subunit
VILPSFDVLEPTSAAEACELLAEHGADARVLAGGTDVLVNMKKRTLFDVHPPPRRGERFAGAPHPWAGEGAASVLVSLGRLPDFSGVTQREDGRIAVGPTTTMNEAAASDLLRDRYTALAEGAAAVGAPTVRNRATVGGNLCHARPAADTAPPFMVLGGALEVVSSAGQREIAADDFIVAPGRSALQRDELVVALVLPALPTHAGSAYLKQINRATLEISVVGAAASLALDGPDGVITDARIALGAVGPRPLRAPTAEAALVGHPFTPALAEAAGVAARNDARPIDDHRGTADYRLEMVEVLVRRAVVLAAERARKGGAHA